MDLINFFIKDNKGGHKSKESFLKKNYNDLYCEILNYTLHFDYMPLNNRIWHYIYKIKEIPVCKKCGVQLKFKKSINEGYGIYCSLLCTNSDINHINNVKITNNKKYGGNSPIHSNDIKKKIMDTNMTRYGYSNMFQDLDRIRERTIEKYGVNHISKLNETKEKIKETNIKRYGVSSPILLKESRNNRIKQGAINFEKKYNHLTIINPYGKMVELVCDICNKKYIIDRSLLLYRSNNNINTCTICNPIGDLSSIKENDLCQFLTSNGIDYIKNDRKILKGKEIDIYIPSHNLAIEFNGVYFHSNLFKKNNYHLNKTKICNSNNIQLIHIFEDEWDNKIEIVKSILLNKLNKVQNKIYARKCELKLVKTSDKTKFLNENHIQGTVGSSINLGLYYNNELVSIMTFGKKRLALGNKKSNNGEYELIRFCNKLNTSVVGGASKLLNHFIKTYSPVEILSYADKRWGNGNLYRKLGFVEVKSTVPNYFYVINKKRRNRFEFRKDILVKEGFDSNKTEFEIMEDRGIPRIYDSGNFLFKLFL